MELLKRKDIRLKKHDYSKNGAYFLTICVKDRHNLLWENYVGMSDGNPPLSDIGRL